jgi:hypothetical protein
MGGMRDETDWAKQGVIAAYAIGIPLTSLQSSGIFYLPILRIPSALHS